MIALVDLREAGPSETLGYLAVLAGNLRSADLAEMDATTDLEPLEALAASVAASEMAWVITFEGEPIAIFGVAPTGAPGSGMVWLVGTPRMDDARLGLGRITAAGIAMMHSRYPCLWNYIDARHKRTLRWLTWAGFRLLEAHPDHGRHGELFYTFARYDPQCVSP
jgi:hypothetical protein